MRVLHFSDTLLGKTETFVQARLVGERFQPVAATWDHVEGGLAIPCPFVVLDRYLVRSPERGMRRLLRGMTRVVARKAEIVRVLMSSRPDVVHAHFGTIGATVSPFCHRLGIPLVVSYYGFDLASAAAPSLRRAYQRMFSHRHTVFTAEGPALARRLVEIGASPDTVRLLPLSLPAWALEATAPRPARQPGSLRLLQVARFVEKKGVDLSLAAVERARRHGVDVTLTLAGDGPLGPGLSAMTRDLGLADAVRFLGYVSHDALPDLLAGVDALIQPSRVAANGDTEGGHPTVLIEALAREIPIVGTRHADIPFVVSDGQNGLLADENDAVGLAAALVRLATEPQLLETLATQARRRILRRHHPATLLLLRERIYREAIRRHPERASRWISQKLPFTDPFSPSAEQK
jgi:colanic acid/amylovoran biosynthesis glycosyltransferase